MLSGSFFYFTQLNQFRAFSQGFNTRNKSKQGKIRHNKITVVHSWAQMQP